MGCASGCGLMNIIETEMEDKENMVASRKQSILHFNERLRCLRVIEKL